MPQVLHQRYDYESFRFREGQFFLGHSFNEGKRHELGATFERNIITIAGSRTGKGACLIIPNLRRWTGNALVIDPKGEAAEQTIKQRHAMMQDVMMLDPFKTTNVRAIDGSQMQGVHYNILSEISPDDPNAFRLINAIADGLVMSHDPRGGHWDGGGKEVLAGLIAHVISAPEFEGRRSLPTVRQLLTDARNLGAVVDAMADNPACGRLPITAAAKLMNTGKESEHFLSVATSNTKWLDDPFMAECLADTTISQTTGKPYTLAGLKNRHMDLFLVLPLDAVGEYGQFLRLFTRVALHFMQQRTPTGDLKGRRCLFVLDEFYSLGHIDEIAKAAGGLPGFGVHLWPILQDSTQLLERYEKGAETFYANASIQTFMGVDDQPTLGMISHMMGTYYSTAQNVPTQPFHSNEHISQYISKDEQIDDAVSLRMIIKLAGNKWLTCATVPYFNPEYTNNVYGWGYETRKQRARNLFHKIFDWKLVLAYYVISCLIWGWISATWTIFVGTMILGSIFWIIEIVSPDFYKSWIKYWDKKPTL